MRSAARGEPLVDVLLVGAGGIGAPAVMGLLAGGVASLAICDDDEVALSNLQRQILFTTRDVGAPKTEAIERAIRARAPEVRVELVRARVVPDNAGELVARARVVLDATDDFGVRFLLADACRLARVPVVHAASIALRATVMAVGPAGRPCYRCLFEAPPGSGDAPTCATAGVLGAVCGLAGHVAADRALRLLAGEAVFEGITTFDALAGRARDVPVRARAGCALCGDGATITALDPVRYTAQACTERP